MGSVYKCKNGWGFRYDLPESTREKRVQKRVTGFELKSDAEFALSNVEKQIYLGTYVADKKLTLNDLISKWQSDHVSNLEKTSQLYYETIMKNHVIPYIGHVKSRDLTPSVITGLYVQMKKKGSSNDLIRKTHVALKACLNQCYRWDLIDRQIMDKITPPKVKKPKIEFLEDDEIDKTLDLFKGKSIELHVILALNLGLRLAETAGLRICDVDFKQRTIHVQQTVNLVKNEIVLKATKNDSSDRVLPMTKDVEKALLKKVETIAKNKSILLNKYNYEWDGYLSVDDNGKLISENTVTNRFRDIMDYHIEKDLQRPENERIGYKKITFHGLRHSCASYLYRKHVPMKSIQMILGHSTYNLTANTYSHVLLKDKEDALKKIRFNTKNKKQ